AVANAAPIQELHRLFRRHADVRLLGIVERRAAELARVVLGLERAELGVRDLADAEIERAREPHGAQHLVRAPAELAPRGAHRELARRNQLELLTEPSLADRRVAAAGILVERRELELELLREARPGRDLLRNGREARLTDLDLVAHAGQRERHRCRAAPLTIDPDLRAVGLARNLDVAVLRRERDLELAAA